MKLEREPVFGHITLSHKPDTKSFEYNELSLNSNGLKSGKVVKENQNGHVHDFQDGKKDASHLLYLVNDGNEIAASKLEFSKNANSVKSHEEDQADDFVAAFTKPSSEIKLLEKDSDCYIDKSATECELPEFQICYKENGYSSIKDICIDEGVHSQDNILFENGVDKKSLCTFVFPDQDSDKQINKQPANIGILGTTDLKSCTGKELNGEFVCEPKDLVPGVEVHGDPKNKLANDISEDNSFPENVVLVNETGAENPQFRSLTWDGDAAMEIQMPSDKESETTQTLSEGFDFASDKLGNNNEEATATAASDSATEESKIRSLVNEIAYSSKVEERRITFNFDSSAAVINAKDDLQNGIPECPDTENTCPGNVGIAGTEIVTQDERLQNNISGYDETPNMVDEATCSAPVDSVQHQLDTDECSQKGANGHVETPITSLDDDEISVTHNLTTQLQILIAKEDRAETSNSERRPSTDTPVFEDGLPGSQAASGHFQYGVGESSFSAAGPMSGRINYSGPVPYSGSISLRSDSSTTSTRSFAFPILQNEWNSSPVRMAKADRRHFRKHRGWRQGLLCCRF